MHYPYLEEEEGCREKNFREHVQRHKGKENMGSLRKALPRLIILVALSVLYSRAFCLLFILSVFYSINSLKNLLPFHKYLLGIPYV